MGRKPHFYMHNLKYNDLSAAYMSICLAKSRNAFTAEELKGVDEVIVKLYEFLESIKTDIENRTTFITDLDLETED